MRLTTLETVTRALNEADVRYLVVGGLAVNAHGYVRSTQDIDLVIALDRNNIMTAFEALADLGYQPSVPVKAADFADEHTRQKWIEEKGMKVLNLFSNEHPGLSVDVFVSEPFDFDQEYEGALEAELREGLWVPFVTLETLIQMKEEADRDRDRDDLQHLRWIREEGERDD